MYSLLNKILFTQNEHVFVSSEQQYRKKKTYLCRDGTSNEKLEMLPYNGYVYVSDELMINLQMFFFFFFFFFFSSSSFNNYIN